MNVDLKKMRFISIIWGTILFLIVITLTAIGIIYKNQTKEFKDFEKSIIEKSKDYLEEKTPTEEKITLEELKEKNIIETLTINEKECTGYILIKKKKESFEYTPYINCGTYKTKGYKE